MHWYKYKCHVAVKLQVIAAVEDENICKCGPLSAWFTQSGDTEWQRYISQQNAMNLFLQGRRSLQIWKMDTGLIKMS